MLIGYARISTQDQNLDLQKDALKAAGCQRILCDTASGAKQDRPKLGLALELVREGDILVVWRLDRLGRTLKHLIELISNLNKRNVGFRSLQESVDTTTSTGKLIFHIFGALAEFERNLIKERTMAGLEAARAIGRIGGRPKKLNEKKCKMLKRLYATNEHSVGDICDTIGVSSATLYKYLRPNRQQRA